MSKSCTCNCNVGHLVFKGKTRNKNFYDAIQIRTELEIIVELEIFLYGMQKKRVLIKNFNSHFHQQITDIHINDVKL